MGKNDKTWEDWKVEPMPAETDLKAIMMDEESPRTRFRRWNTVINWAIWNGMPTVQGNFSCKSWASWAAKRQGFNRYGGQSFTPSPKIDNLQKLIDGCVERNGKLEEDLTADERQAIEDRKMADLASNPALTTTVNRYKAGIAEASDSRWGNGDMSDKRFLEKVVDQILSGKTPSAKQTALCEKILGRKAEAAKRLANADVGWADVVALMHCAKPFYKKSPSLKIKYGSTKIVLYVAGHRSKYTGQIMVKEWRQYQYSRYGERIHYEDEAREEYYGRITMDGEFVKARAAGLVWPVLEDLRDGTLEFVAEFGHRMGRMGKITQTMMNEWKQTNGLGTVTRENLQRAKAKKEGVLGNLKGVSAEPTLAELMAGFGNTEGSEEEE